MAYTARVCIKAARLGLMTAVARGLDLQALLDEYGRHGLDAARLADPYARIPHELLDRLFCELPLRLRDDAFGLHAAELGASATHDAFDAALRNCRTGADVFAMLARYVRLLHEGAVVELRREPGLVRCAERFPGVASVPPHFAEMVLGMWVLRLRQLLSVGVDGSPGALPLLSVELRHPAPPSLREHQRLFGCALRFEAVDYAIVLHESTLAAPLPGADPMLGLVLERHLRELHDKLPPPDDLLAAVRAAVDAGLGEPDLDIDRVARRLATSRRTLQRRLGALGTSFHALLDQARREQALRHLRDPSLTLADVAFMTGYAEMSAFFRAFRRWTGQTPGEFRSRSLDPAPG